MEDLKTVKIYLHRYEAEEAKALLKYNGIEAIVSADDCAGYRPDIKLGVAVKVEPKHFEDASGLLNYVRNEEELRNDEEYRGLKIRQLKNKIKECKGSRYMGVVFFVAAISLLIFYQDISVFIFAFTLLAIGIPCFLYSKNNLVRIQKELKEWENRRSTTSETT